MEVKAKEELASVEDELAFALLEAQLKLHQVREAASKNEVAKILKLVEDPSEQFVHAIDRWTKLRKEQ